MRCLLFALTLVYWCSLLTAQTITPTVTLSWLDNANNEERFPIQRRVDANTTWLNVHAAPAAPGVGTRPQWVDTFVERGRKYTYRVAAENENARSAFTSPVEVTLSGGLPPAAPGAPQVKTPGILVNVSARALVRSDDLTVIPGFVISGGPLRVLVRAIGPGLASQGVPNVLADPRFEVIRTDVTPHQVVGQNDNWAADLADDFSSVSAFPLTAGSKDAAIVVNLPSGNYTVVVRGADATPGVALVEAYALP